MPSVPISFAPNAAGPIRLFEITLASLVFANEPRRNMPYRALTIALFVKVLLSLSRPSFVALILAPEESIPNVAVVFAVSSAPADRLQFLITLWVAPAPVPALDNQITAVDGFRSVFEIVRFLVALPLFEPSITT